MKKTVLFLSFLLLGLNIQAQGNYLRIEGQDIVKPDGSKFFIQGTNLGNWLNPEGYMFGFEKPGSVHFINEMLCQLVGPRAAARFWQQFKENYITREDIRFIAECGANTVRVPFHYKLFTTEDYMGLDNNTNEGFRLIDRLVEWCREEGLYIVLDMHDCPGGQTGDNIDDSYGYCWLLTERADQEQFINIWQRIAAHYKNEPVILGYELMNEAMATYFNNQWNELTSSLASLYKECAQAVRQVDPNHIIILGGANWNTNFDILDLSYDSQLMLSCHRYGGEATRDAIASFIQAQQKFNRPMYMGEIGHGTNEWQSQFSDVLRACNIGYTYWPYKKVDGSCMAAISRPYMWDKVVTFAEATRDSYEAIRKARSNLSGVNTTNILNDFLSNCLFNGCRIQGDYIKSLKLGDIPVVKLNGTSMPSTGYHLYESTLSVSKGQVLSLTVNDVSGALDADVDFFEETTRGLRFRALSGNYRIKVDLDHHWVSAEMLNANGQPASLQADGSGAIWIIGGWGIGKPNYQSAGRNWDPNAALCLASPESNVFEITLEAGKQLNPEDVDFKFFAQRGWGKELKGTGNGGLRINSSSQIFGVGTGTNGHDDGNIYLRPSRTLTPGASYRFTLTTTNGTTFVMTVEEVNAGTAVNAPRITVTDDSSWYRMDGKKEQVPTSKNIYIHNGKKVIH